MRWSSLVANFSNEKLSLFKTQIVCYNSSGVSNLPVSCMINHSSSRQSTGDGTARLSSGLGKSVRDCLLLSKTASSLSSVPLQTGRATNPTVFSAIDKQNVGHALCLFSTCLPTAICKRNISHGLCVVFTCLLLQYANTTSVTLCICFLPACLP